MRSDQTQPSQSYLVSLAARLSLARPSARASTSSSLPGPAAITLTGSIRPSISFRLRSCTMSTQSSHLVRVVCTPGVRGNPRNFSILASSVTTLACSLRLSITSLSTLVGLGGSLGMGRLLEEEIFFPGFCLASEASVFFRSFSSDLNCS